MEPLEVRASLGLAADPISARLARRFITEFCNAADLGEEICQLATLLTSELVTNAVKYGGSHAVLEAHTPGGTLRVTVQDGNPFLPDVGNAPDLTAEGGRGIVLVSNLADRWGVERLPGGGKAIWFELDLDATT